MVFQVKLIGVGMLECRVAARRWEGPGVLGLVGGEAISRK